MKFDYSQKELEIIKLKDEKIKIIIEEIGYIERECIDDLFQGLFFIIIGQQLSQKAQVSIWERAKRMLKSIDPVTISTYSVEEIKKVGLSLKKATFIKGIADKIVNREINLNLLYEKDDQEVCEELTKLDGIGVWSAEMVMIFCMNRKNVFSFSDTAIKKALKIIYGHKEITKDIFENYRRLFSPYCSIVSLYLWEISNRNYKNKLSKKNINL
ncbi:methylated-DNA-protein-cysteine methyltransferase [Cryptosporidium ubiquitum]|uniref:Methylated-DNA-protein-cysteine methyltransferase n=1 Tax=Cryptosporidium ubiquitum TaxID=857276 RepID=A0A1J4MQW6_9CRYT|nr:methylated-DNA-protein-cysteine methyltransferase [Cryptosporidium ubiquitum]OII75285.1 methylated-DNA-protein-cysteine methyltransferase [Cryptosporidium ubiquitum]